MIIASLLIVITALQTGSTIPIYTEDELGSMSKCLDCHYVLLANISLLKLWSPIGTIEHPFTGSFDGRGNSIGYDGMIIHSHLLVGLFGAIVGGSIRDLRISAWVSMDISDKYRNLRIGLLAGYAVNTTFFGCSTNYLQIIKLSAGTMKMGGFAGELVDCTVSACFANVTASIHSVSSLYLGGFVGNSTRTKYDRCEAQITSTVDSGGAVYQGGFIGESRGSLITSSIATGSMASNAQSTIEYIGGFISFSVPEPGGTVVESVLVNVKVSSTRSLRAEIGGIVGHPDGIFGMTKCDALFYANCVTNGLVMGGLVGNATGSTLYTSYTRVNMTAIMGIMEDTPPTTYVGGLVGYALAKTNTIAHTTVYTLMNLTAVHAVIGGAVAAGDNLQVQDCTVVGVILAQSLDYANMIIGGIVGKTSGSTLSRCLFVGDIAAGLSKELIVGTLGGTIAKTSVRFSYALANISCSAIAVTAGTFGLVTGSQLSSCYAVLYIQARAKTSLALGGLAGNLADNTSMISSFVLANMSAAEAQTSVVGGLAASVQATDTTANIMGCYVWGVITAASENRTIVFLGGLVGDLVDAFSVTNCLAYVTLSAPSTGVIVGALAGRISQKSAADKPPRGKVASTVVYATPDGGITGVRLIGTGPVAMVADTYCAAYANTEGCTALDTLNSQEFLKTFDTTGTLQLNASVANSSLTLKAMPAPASRAPISSPRMVLAEEGVNIQWSGQTWVSNKAMMGGFPYLRYDSYGSFCRPTLGCHGFGVSPLDVVCYTGWSSPQRDSPRLVDSVSQCSTHACQTSADCRWHGSCGDGVCKCDVGYTGPDCSVPICPMLDGAPCGHNRCKPFSAESQIGVCACQPTEYLSTDGLCLPGCQSVGAGVCQGSDTISCFAGYSPATGCLAYDCSAVTENVCNKKGTCNGNACTCSDGNVLLNGNCYTPCGSATTKGCIKIQCGAKNWCLELGLCTSALSGDIAECACNVDQAGRGTGKHRGGPLCDECAVGYALFQGECVPDRCIACRGGTCTYDSASKAYECKCDRDQILLSGVCLTNSCGECHDGQCMVVPRGSSPDRLFCFCNTGLPGEACYGYSCGSCREGSCRVDSKMMTVACECPAGYPVNDISGDCVPAGQTQRNLVIVLPIVLLVAVAACVAVAVVVLLRRHRQRKMAIEDPADDSYALLDHEENIPNAFCEKRPHAQSSQPFHDMVTM